MTTISHPRIWFGTSVTMEENVVVIEKTGAVYVYAPEDETNPSTTWTNIAKLIGSSSEKFLWIFRSSCGKF
jgi:hypothetical protein